MNNENYTVNWNLMTDGADGIDSTNEAIASGNEQKNPEQTTEDVEAKKPEEASKEEIKLDDLYAEAKKRGLNVGEKSEAKNTRKGRISAIVSWLKKTSSHLFEQSNEKKDETTDSDAAKPTNWHFGEPIHQWDEESKTFVNVVQHAKNAESAQNAQKTDNDKLKDKTSAAPEQPEQTPKPASSPKEPNEKLNTEDSKKDEKPKDAEKDNKEADKKVDHEPGDKLMQLCAEKFNGDRKLQRDILEALDAIENGEGYKGKNDFRIWALRDDISRGNKEDLTKHIKVILGEEAD